jgi:hypothetical protein
MPGYDVTEIARLLSEGKSMTEIATALDGPQVDQAAATQRRQLQDARGALNAESAPPGTEPEADPVESMIDAARRSGSPRGSQGYIDAGLSKLFEAARAGDPRVTAPGNRRPRNGRAVAPRRRAAPGFQPRAKRFHAAQLEATNGKNPTTPPASTR